MNNQKPEKLVNSLKLRNLCVYSHKWFGKKPQMVIKNSVYPNSCMYAFERFTKKYSLKCSTLDKRHINSSEGKRILNI